MRRPASFRLHPQSVWSEDGLRAAFQKAGIANADLHVVHIWQHLIRHPKASFSDVDGLPKAALAVLERDFVVHTSTVAAVQRSTDGDTLKLLVKLQDGHRIESVIMKYDTRLKRDSDGHGKLRSTLCVSSQVGCQMGCTFCATGAIPDCVCASGCPLLHFEHTGNTGPIAPAAAHAFATQMQCRW
jgi:adenine C2-methylase RlmN of 23S rRNA A2503 and tRNA A37